MDRVPQSDQLNPAFQPKCDFYFQLPSLQYNLRNSFSVNDILTLSGDSLLTPIYSVGNADQLLQKLKSKNSLINSFQVDGLSLGFRVKDMYFTLGLSVKMDVNMFYPKDLVRLLSKGLFDESSSYDLKNFGVDATAYSELALGVSKNYNDEITFGIKAKLLSGILNVTTQNNQFTIYNTIGADSLPRVNIHSDMNIRSSADYFNIEIDSSGQFKNASFVKDGYKQYKPFRSMGAGFDFGVSYTGLDKFIFSASLLDVGFIKWRDNENNLKLKGDTSFAGLSKIDFFNNILNKFADSLLHVFKFSKTNTTYTTWLPAKLYLGAEFLPVPFFSLGFLSLSQYYRQQFYQQFMLSANLRFFRMCMLSTSYSIFDNGFSNMGIGFSFRPSLPFVYFPPLNIYFIADNIPLRFAKNNQGFPVPYKANAFDFRFGMNIIFGCGQQRKMKDKPLIVE